MTETASTSEHKSPQQRIAELEAENATLRHVIGCKKYIQEYFKRYGYDEKDITEKLHRIDETHVVWMACQLTLERAILQERQNLLTATSNENLWEARGRYAGLEDFQASLFRLWCVANKSLKAH